MDGQLISEEGEATPDATMPTTATTPVTMKLSGRAVLDRSVVAQVRLARKAKERGAKEQRVERAVRRWTASQHGVELAVAQTDGECCERRQQQADEGRNELKEKRERRCGGQSDQDQPTGQRAHMGLVQRRVKSATKVARGLGVEADDGPHTAIMEVDG
ncbi:unnamed protein product [Phytophthora fragariaefolia]|uniref:Unnamed protein product n=1 Tax=Phytophthora fragariaefolia TaxID=1490495 RepID=A0A9W6TMI2_9STRA|nr:unnamed protein product [Phytophthora fragariaefolia]